MDGQHPGTYLQAPFEAGDRVELVSMRHDPDPIEPGARGTVLSCSWLSTWSQFQIMMRWDTGRTLALLMPPDVVLKVLAEPPPRNILV